MADEQFNQFNSGQPQYNAGLGIRDLEERQRILKDRILLIGKNLVESKERNNKEILEIRKEVETIKQDIKRMADFLKSASAEFSKFARKDELQILSKQAKMFQPLNFVTKQELKRMLRENK
jgi:3'-phosphoadenosine 5'-phosphosulfate sulfotransferase (PAPS reductase)/FAD synthetase